MDARSLPRRFDLTLGMLFLVLPRKRYGLLKTTPLYPFWVALPLRACFVTTSSSWHRMPMSTVLVDRVLPYFIPGSCLPFHDPPPLVYSYRYHHYLGFFSENCLELGIVQVSDPLFSGRSLPFPLILFPL